MPLIWHLQQTYPSSRVFSDPLLLLTVIHQLVLRWGLDERGVGLRQCQSLYREPLLAAQ